MNREEAKDYIREWCPYDRQEEIIKALEQEPCNTDTCKVVKAYMHEWDKPNNSDAISRQYLLDNCVMDKVTMPYVPINRIENAPSVNPQEPKWIPVSERLPEESLNSVIGWDAYRERCVFVQYIDGHFRSTGSYESFNIKAWMPLPQPYKAESEEQG